MLLRLRALGLVSLYVGVRVGDVYERTLEVGGREVHTWGWNYRTLEGHVEMGQMAWEVWKWLATGEVEFRVHAISRDAHIPNLVIRLGYRLVRGHERRLFLEQHQPPDAHVRASRPRRGRRSASRSAAPPTS